MTLTWTRKCNLTISGDNYLDVMLFKENTLIYLITNKSNWQTMNKSVSALLPYTAYGFKVREVSSGQSNGVESEIVRVQTKEAGKLDVNFTF